ncbi:MAG: aldehyde dehydrogenase family protein [Rhodoglobus sp.]
MDLFGDSTLIGPAPGSVIGGQVRVGVSAAGTLGVTSPSTGLPVADVPSADDALVDEAVAVAVAAQKPWGKLSHIARAEVLERIKVALGTHSAELAHIVSTEQGKPITDALGEIGAAQRFFDFAITQKYRDIGEAVATEPGEQLLIREEAIGVVAAILPWNFPAAIFARKVAPALMAGNAVIIKPSELTPLSAMALARVCHDAGLPTGLIGVVCGEGRTVGQRLVTHQHIGMVTMTGSTRGGREILTQCAPQLIPVSLELGGKAPFIVFADADLELAVDDAISARLWNSGQVCTCNEITYVHESIHDQFVAKVADKLSRVHPLDPFDPSSSMGPLVSEREWTKVRTMVDRAVEQGATVAVGGDRPNGDEFTAGNWFAPTLLTGVTSDMDIARDEVFGPVLSVVPFATYDEVITAANSTPYGLTAYVYSRDLATAMRAVDDLEFGEIYVNKASGEQVQGFHTGWKASGLGGDDGRHGYERYLRRKTSYVKYDDRY